MFIYVFFVFNTMVMNDKALVLSYTCIYLSKFGPTQHYLSGATTQHTSPSVKTLYDVVIFTIWSL